jgi:hypothetical protein
LTLIGNEVTGFSSSSCFFSAKAWSTSRGVHSWPGVLLYTYIRVLQACNHTAYGLFEIETDLLDFLRYVERLLDDLCFLKHAGTDRFELVLICWIDIQLL